MPSRHVMTKTIKDFYDNLTPFYHLIYPDWGKSIERQASMLDLIIRKNWGDQVSDILDVACGIGTQSLGLAALGYQVTASDLSEQAVERAKRESAIRGLSISFSIADMRSAFDIHSNQFDITIACDNAIPHLLTDEEILNTFRQLLQCTRPGGGCIISVRDYEAEEKVGQSFKVYGSRQENGITFFIFQSWDWEGEYYDLSMYFIEDDGSTQCRTHVMRSKYYAVSITKLIDLMIAAGFHNVTRLDDEFFQPVVIGSRTA